MAPDAALVDRFRAGLDALSPPEQRIGVAVSGGPDSIALLLLAAAARPGFIEAATVDHGFRSESADEATMVATVCEKLGVPHATLTADWQAPTTAIQERARELRYRLLERWCSERRLSAIATAHHADDQAETLVMRLNRGAGVRGLAGIRARSTVPDSSLPLLRPLLGWRRAELDQVCEAAGITPATDPSNSDDKFERVRVRQGLAGSDWIDPDNIARSAEHLAAADDALDWMTESLALVRVTDRAESLQVDARGLPAELQRRLLLFAFARFHAPEPRGPELTRALDALRHGKIVTLAGLKLQGGETWQVSAAPGRTRPSDNLR